MALIKFHKDLPEFLSFCGGRVSVTDEQCKSSDHSLCWEYSDGDNLKFATDIGYIKNVESNQDSRVNVFAMYVFGNGDQGLLHIEFLKHSISCADFDIHLGFEGWRHIYRGFDSDMNGEPAEGMDELIITAKGTGCVLLDEILTCNKGDCRAIMKSEQLPYVKRIVVPLVTEMKLKATYNPNNVASEEIYQIAERYRQYVLNEYDNGKTAEELIQDAEILCIRKGRFGLYGKRIEHPMQRNVFVGTDGEGDTYITLRTVTELMCAIAVRYGKTGDTLLLQTYVRILEYLINNGLAYGSTFGSHQVLDYSMRHLYFSLAVMINEQELLPFYEKLSLALRWFTHFDNRGFSVGQDLEQSSTDDFFNLTPGIIVLALLMPNDKEKSRYLKAISTWLDFNLQCTDGLTDMIKADGCIYHHANHYPAYGNGAMTGITPMLYAFGGTQYDISDEARNNIRKVLLTIRFQSAGTMFATAFAGRHPLKQDMFGLIPYRYYAKYELLKGNTDMASVYLRLAGGNITEADKNIIDSKAMPEDIPEGNNNYPMACANVHRRDNWMLVTKGYSKYIWGNESYLADNHYGRYLSYGAIELYNDVENSLDRYREEGYDWNRVAGTTSLIVPFDCLRSQIYNLDKISGFEEMLISDQSFVGGNSLNGNGMFSMILTEHPKYNGNFCAYKSVFAKDSFILAIGSNISDNSGFEAETTLFQNRVLSGDPKILKENNRIFDNRGNAYYVYSDAEIYMSEGLQHSFSGETDDATEGEFAVASIRHGANPQNESYAYGIGVNGAPECDFDIIRQDEKAHIVRIENITYMALFEAGDYGDIYTDIPIMVMIEKREDSVSLALSNPDLNLYTADESQYDENGNRREVSIYGRKWLKNRIGGKFANIRYCGRDLSLYLRGGDIAAFNL